MQKVIVTGATSFIGVHLIEKLLAENWEVYGVIRPNSSNLSRLPQHNHLHVVELELSEINQLPQHVTQADCFYHLAWEGARLPHRDDPVMQKKNYDAAVAAMYAAHRLGCRCFVGFGSQAEYGTVNGPVDENYPPLPITEYGKYKLNAYHTLDKLAQKMNIHFVWLRIFSLYGKYDYPGTLIMSCIDKMQKNAPISLTQCSQNWDYLHVEDAAVAIALFAEIPCEDGVYHIASGNSRPLRAYVEEMKETLRSDSLLDFGAVPYGSGGPVNLEPDVNKTKETLGWEPKISFAQGILKIVQNSSN